MYSLPQSYNQTSRFKRCIYSNAYGNVVHGETQWAEFRNNWITNEDPGFVNPDNPLEGFKTDADLFKYIPGFPQLPFDKIGSKLP